METLLPSEVTIFTWKVPIVLNRMEYQFSYFYFPSYGWLYLQFINVASISMCVSDQKKNCSYVVFIVGFYLKRPLILLAFTSINNRKATFVSCDRRSVLRPSLQKRRRSEVALSSDSGRRPSSQKDCQRAAKLYYMTTKLAIYWCLENHFQVALVIWFFINA